VTRIVYAGGQVFDGTGADPFTADVAVADGLIAEVGRGLDGDEVVDASGATLLPGFIDCHVHVLASAMDELKLLHQPFSYQFYDAVTNLRKTLHAGITTARDAGGADLGVQRALEHVLISGPRLQISITILSQTGGHGDGWLPSGAVSDIFCPHPGRPGGVVDGPDEMRRAARQLMRAGAQVIKVCTTGGVLSPLDDPRHSQFGMDELAVLTAEAAAQGRYVMAHAQGAGGIKNAVRAGVRSIEHGIYADDEAIALMAEHGTYLVPTMIAPIAVIRAAESGVPLPVAVVDKAHDAAAAHRDTVSRAHQAGVRIAMGTDSGVGPHGTNLEELPLMVAAGMSPADVLASTTSVAASLLGWGDTLGRIEPGFAADLLVVDGDPYDLDTLPSRLRTVVQAGRPVAR